MLSVQKLTGPSFGTKFVVGEHYHENDKKRIQNIGKEYRKTHKDNPKDTFVVNSGYLEYYKKGNTIPLRFQLDEEKGYIKELLKQDDKTILEKFSLITDIAKQAFKCDEETGKFIDKIQKMTGDDSIYVGNDYEEYGVGEAYALNSVKNDPILKDIVEYAVFD
ncbi:hypothetical protein J6N69_03795 [bacterium]|nr:hypothetical protein [bacterium]MBP3846507.1 hypothetical protein [bacterium]